MKRLALLLTLSIGLSAQISADESTFFPEKGTHFGVYYYPEHWQEDQWERDIKRVAELGFDFIHYAEFSWARLEPEEGKYDFAWLDKAIQLAADNNLKVIMSTPSPCIPAWLATKHPEVLRMGSSGKRNKHTGSRLTGSLANPIYQENVARIATQLAERYSKDKRVWGWQIGNEPHIQGGADYSPSAHKEFIQFLKNKYGTIDKLNASWGAAFWSFTHNNFDQVNLPGGNPHAILDFETYTSQEIARDLIDQAQIVRNHGDGKQWVTTNYAYYKGLKNVNPFLTRNDLDFASRTMYLTHNRKNSSGDSLAHRLGCGMEYALSGDLTKSVSGYMGIMELQPSQINWGKFNAMPMPGAVRMWVWHAFGMGDRFVCTYRFRQPLYGMEQFHHGIMQTDGISVSRGGKDFVKAVNEINALEEQLDPKATDPFVEKSRTGILWSNRNIIDIENYKHHQDWDTWQHIYTYYQNLKRMGVDVPFFGEGDALDPKHIPFLVVPAYQMMTRALIVKLEAYANAGGHLIISTRSGLKDGNGHLWETKIQEPIWKLIGGEIKFYDHLPANHPGKITFNQQTYPWHIWGTVTEPFADTESWATFEDQFYQGKSAILHRKAKQGSVTYVGAWSDGWEMEYDILRQLYGTVVGKLPFDLPPYVFAHYRQGLWTAVNYTDQVIDIPTSKGSKILMGKQALPPAGVLVWKE
ncbi:MAG: beta-galactosidase [Verrucomicrobiae bacterium]|nr:beta-galactosidase [Verrucomicrobiae bacterium]NNJ43988.1 cellulase family glycosylhydrolase [Akkermansiaceae bacterium]